MQAFEQLATQLRIERAFGHQGGNALGRAGLVNVSEIKKEGEAR